MFWTKKTTEKYVPARVRDALSTRFNEHELGALSRLGTIVDVPAGQTLTSQGTAGRQALVIVSGTASVVRNDVIVATVSDGDVVGEMSLITGEPRTATVVADTAMQIYALTPREFSSLLAQCPRLAQRIPATAVRRLGELSAA